MAFSFTILSGIFSSVFSAMAFGGANLALSMLTDHGIKECKRHDLEEEKLQRARNKWNEYRMERLDFINKRLREKNEAKAYISNVDEESRIWKKVKPLPPEPELSDFYHPSETQKMASYYLLQWAQILQHMLCISNLNK